MFCQKKACTRAQEWAGALSWWSCQSPLAHSYSRLLLTASLSQQRTSMQYSLVIVWPGEVYSWWGNTFKIKNKNCQHGLDNAMTLRCLLQTLRLRRLPLGRPGFCFRVTAIHPWLICGYDLCQEIWVTVSSFKQILCNFSMKFLLLLWQEPWNKFCRHISCLDPPPKSLKQESMESPDLLLIFALSIVNLHWLQTARIQHIWVFWLLKAFQNMDHFQRIPGHLWSISTTIFAGLHPLNHPRKPS